MTIEQYIKEFYKKDLELYKNNIGSCLCGRVINKYFSQNTIKLKDEMHFFICQFELNLLNQVFYNYFGEYQNKWLENSLPFVDCRCTYSKSPVEVFHWVIQESKNNNREVIFIKKDILLWDLFITNHIVDILKKKEFNGLTIERIFKVIKGDKDCQSGAKYLANL